MKITILGSGTSHGVPVVGCGCPVCASADSRDKRMRASVYLEGRDGESALIDTGPEFRLQAVRAGIKHLDAIFLTHSHADHIHGLDDIRPLSRESPIPVYGSKETIAEMKERFSYIFGSPGKMVQRGGGKPRLEPCAVDGPVRIGSLIFTPVPVKHGILDIFGWEVEEAEERESLRETTERGKSFLYLTDTSAVPPASRARLKKTPESRVIVIGALRKRPHETHFNFEEALNTALGLDAEKIYLTHICHDHFHEEIEEFCRNFRPAGNFEENREFGETEIHPAWDGLEIIF